MGTDGEGWCKRGAEFFPAKVRSTGHLDPFHVNRAVLSCFDKENARGAWHVLDVLNDSDGEGGVPLARGHARLRHRPREKGGRGGRLPAQQHRPRGRRGPLAGHDGVREPASVRLAHGQRPVRLVAPRRIGDGQGDQPEVPRSGRSRPLTRSRSLTPRRAKQRERRILSALAGGTGKVVECVGSGYLPPHRASLVGKSAEVRYAAGIDKGMIPVLG
ncbi:MAG: hypothetical protein ACLTDR_16730 [Adlercreutzia equolifaciens]